MYLRSVRRSFRPLALALAFAAAASPAFAQGAYSPPKLAKMGSNTTPIAGSGSVQLQVFVRKDGSPGTIKVEKSSNHADDTAAVEAARSSSYRPATRNGKPVDAYYTFRLTFKGNSVSAADSAPNSGALASANALLRANKFDQARTSLEAYLSSHPGDQQAEAMLGVADAYTNQNTAAAAAFDAAGTIPDRFRAVASKAYSDAALDALKARNDDQAIALSGKALALGPNVSGLYIRATAEANEQKFTQAIADFEAAKAQAATAKADAGTANAIDTGLATAYLMGGQSAKGLALAADLKRRDPSNTRIDDALAAYYNNQAASLVKSGKSSDAVASLESAAQAVPSRGASLYTQAANVLATQKPADWKRVKAEADKALAIAPNDPDANYIAGIAVANGGDKNAAVPYLQKAKANVGSDAKLSADIDGVLKQLGSK